jgi:Wadjet anti plasmid transformation system JetA-like protein
MRPNRPPTRQRILTALLEKHERSVSYGRPAPWPQDVILRLDKKAFPEAFAPDGREIRTQLVVAAQDLERDGCIRLPREAKGPHRGDPKEMRLGPSEVARAYAEARKLGFEPLAVGLDAVRSHPRALLTDRPGRVPDWLEGWCRALESSLARADPAPLAVARERFKKEWRLIPDALTASAALACGEVSGWERFASERLFRDSKRLARVRPWIVRALVGADPRWEGVPPEEAFDLLESYGLRRKPGLIRSAGGGAISVADREIRLEDFVPVAHLPDAWAAAWVDAVCASGISTITTIENEYPYLAHVEEAGGPAGLASRGELAVYTAGFPTPALVAALRAIAGRAPSIAFRHWGDADLGGVRIWLFLRTRIGRPLEPYRTTAEWVRREAADGRRLSPIELRALRRLRAELLETPGEDFAAIARLTGALLETGVKLEQEHF